MVLSNRRIPQSAAVSRPIYRVVYRSLFALCMILAPLTIFLSFAVDPTNGVPGNAHRIFTTFHAAGDTQIQWFLFFNLQKGPATFIVAFATTRAIIAQIHLITMVITAYQLLAGESCSDLGRRPRYAQSPFGISLSFHPGFPRHLCTAS